MIESSTPPLWPRAFASRSGPRRPLPCGGRARTSRCASEGNTRDNDEIYDSTAVVRSGAEDIEVVSGLDQIEKAAREGYEFVSVIYER